MYTLKDVVKKGLSICCPEAWQRNEIVSYFKEQLKEKGWDEVNYHRYGKQTYFGIDEDIFDDNTGYATFYGNINQNPKGNFIQFEDFAEIAIPANINIDIFEDFLLEE